MHCVRHIRKSNTQLTHKHFVSNSETQGCCHREKKCAAIAASKESEQLEVISEQQWWLLSARHGDMDVCPREDQTVQETYTNMSSSPTGCRSAVGWMLTMTYTASISHRFTIQGRWPERDRRTNKPRTILCLI